MSKGVFEAGMKFFIGLVLTLVFFALAYALLFTSLGPRAVDAANFYVFSKVGVTISPERFGRIAPEGILDAKITVMPEDAVCQFETVYFSANSTTLPKDVKFEDLSCFWDFDLSTEPKTGAQGSAGNDGDTENDFEATTCDTAESRSWPTVTLPEEGRQGVKLVVIDPTGKRDDAIRVVKGTFFCACSAPGTKCPGGSDSVTHSPQLGAELSNGQALTINFKSSWSIESMHFVLEPVGNVSRLNIDVNDDGTRDYSFPGNLTGQSVIHGQNLLNSVGRVRATCNQNLVEPCPVKFVFYLNGKVRLKEIWIPLATAAPGP